MSTTRIDLSDLPFPDAVTSIDYEQIVADCKSDLIAKDTNNVLAAVLNLESEPLTMLVEVIAYRIMLQTNLTNEKAKALMLAYAIGSDLDQLGANADVYRMTIVPADPNANPPTDVVMEPDDAFRRRIQLAPERDAAGSEGAYTYWGLSADPDVRDIGVIVTDAGEVQIWVQSRSAAVAPQSLLDAVNTALDPSTRRPLTDSVTIHAATPTDFTIEAELTLFPGPDPDVVLAAANTAEQAYTNTVSYLGYDVVQSGLYAALHQPGVQRVNLISPAADIVLPRSQYARCTSVNITTLEYRDV